jgi:DNA-binding winged helix-turn-helix (wHTH) protein
MISHNNASLTRSQLPEWPATKSTDAAQLVAVRELLGRLEALLKRPDEIPETTLSVGPLRLDLLTRTVARGQRSINLLPREFRLLEYLMRHHGQLVTRAMLFTDVWNYNFVPQSNLVDVHMGRLRRKIDESAESPMIYSFRGQGFMLRAPIWAHLPSSPARSHVSHQDPEGKEWRGDRRPLIGWLSLQAFDRVAPGMSEEDTAEARKKAIKPS